MKVAGSVASLLGGVSQQVPKDRLPGQHGEQINMIPDPVRGLCRRRGTLREATLVGTGYPGFDLDKDAAGRVSYDFAYAGKDYVAIYKSQVGNSAPVAHVYDKTSKTFLSYNKNPTDDGLTLAEVGGIRAITSVGKYLFMATDAPVVATDTPRWLGTPLADVAAVWVRGGVFGRSYTVDVTHTGGRNLLTVTTPKAAYPTPLDTSFVSIYQQSGNVPVASRIPVTARRDPTTGLYVFKVPHWGFNVSSVGVGIRDGEYASGIRATADLDPPAGTVLPPNSYWYAPEDARDSVGVVQGGRLCYVSDDIAVQPSLFISYYALPTVANANYTSQVSSVTEGYNAAVTAWISAGATAIKPESIAAEFVTAATSLGIPATRVGSTVIFSTAQEVVLKDGGDGTLLRGVGRTITDNSQLTLVHAVGKVVKVLPPGSDNAYYLEAFPKVPGESGNTEVVWKEAAGYGQTLTGGLIYGHIAGGVLSVASSPTLLAALTSEVPPDWSPRLSGDGDNSKTPYFVGRSIDFMTVFQDRLVVVSGAVVSFSKVGEYLTFYRKSALTVTAGDSFELISQGSEDDTIRRGVLYDRNLVLMGNLRQYVVDGSRPVTALATSMPVMSNHPRTADAPPLAAGGVIFYGQSAGGSVALYQIQPGKSQNSTDSFPLSSQVSGYLRGDLIELLGTVKPTHLVVRATGDLSSLYVYTYLDSIQGGRVQGAWHTFKFGTALGPIAGFTRTPQGMLVFFLRQDAVGSGWHIVADFLDLDTGLSELPYLDSMVPYIPPTTGAFTHVGLSSGVVAFSSKGPHRLFGSPLQSVGDLVADYPSPPHTPWAGYMSTASFVPTNPFYRGADGKPIVSGPLTIGALTVNVSNSSGFTAVVATDAGVDTTEYTGRVLGAVTNQVDAEVISSGAESVIIASETQEYTLTIAARSWLPLTITTIEWRGQLFNRTRNI
jgi:hypothetical protein